MKKTLLLLLCSAGTYCYAQTNIFPASGNVGIGITAPTDLLHINHGAARKGITLVGDGDAAAYTDILLRANDISAIPTGTSFAWNISHRKDGYFSDNAAPGSSLEFYSLRKGVGYYAPLSFKSNGDVVLVSPKNAISGKVGIGTTTPTEKLSVNGNIRAREVKVEAANWPDYVFEESYQPISLPTLKTFVKEHKHLPGIPSAKEVKEEGLSLGKMNRKLLEKIEELTLHVIRQQEELNSMKAALEAIRKRDQ